MQELLEYVFFVLNNVSKSNDNLDSQVLAEIRSKVSNLSKEELNCLKKLFISYENYYTGLLSAEHKLTNDIKDIDRELDFKIGIVGKFSRIDEYCDQCRKIFLMLGNLYDIVEERLLDLHSQKRNL